MNQEILETLLSYIDAKVEMARKNAIGEQATKEVLQNVEVLPGVLRDMVWQEMSK